MENKSDKTGANPMDTVKSLPAERQTMVVIGAFILLVWLVILILPRLYFLGYLIPVVAAFMVYEGLTGNGFITKCVGKVCAKK